MRLHTCKVVDEDSILLHGSIDVYRDKTVQGEECLGEEVDYFLTLSILSLIHSV